MQKLMKTWWMLPLALTAVVRLVFYLATPMLDNDSIVIFMGARELAAGRALSMVNTLPVLIAGLLYRLFGEHILLARAAQILAGFGTMALLYTSGRRVSLRVGAAAAVIFGTLPIAIVYASIAKSYSLTVFFIFAGALLWAAAVEKKESVAPAVFAGLCFASAFACYTFAASALFPLILIFCASIFMRKLRPMLLPSLVTGTAFGLCLAGLVAWRWKAFGWSIFNDYPTDWRFDLASAIWQGRWEGLTDIWGLGIALLIPGILVICHNRGAFSSLGPLGWYGLIFALINVLLWVFNPVNHFPRVLLICLPFICLFVALGLERLALERIHLGTVLAWMITAGVALFTLYPRLQPGNQAPALFSPQSGRGIAMSVLFIAFLFLALLAVLRPLRSLKFKTERPVFVTVILAFLVTGPAMAWQSVTAQAQIFQGRAELVQLSDASSILGGGDYQHIAGPHPESFAWLPDLTPEELNRVLDLELIDVLKSHGISHVIVSNDDPEGELAMLAGMALEQGRDIRNIGRVWRPLYDTNIATRTAHNGYGALYQLTEVEPVTRTADEKKRLAAYHAPFEFSSPSDLLAFNLPIRCAGGDAFTVEFTYAGEAFEPGISIRSFLSVDDKPHILFRQDLEKWIAESEDGQEGNPTSGMIDLTGENRGGSLVVEIQRPDGSIFRQIGRKIPETQCLHTAGETSTIGGQ